MESNNVSRSLAASIDMRSSTGAALSEKQRDIDADLKAQEDQIRQLLDKMNIMSGAPPSNPFATSSTSHQQKIQPVDQTIMAQA